LDFVKYWKQRSQIGIMQILLWMGVSIGRFKDWEKRYGKMNQHNGLIPRYFWIEEWEKQAVIRYYNDHQYDGYRRLTYMMIDDDIVAMSPSSVYRILKQAGLLEKWQKKLSKKGEGFKHPLKAHEHWHIDISYINICGTFYYLCAILDGYSRFIVHWEIREHMREADVEIIMQRAKEIYPLAKPRIISDNGPQFIAKDFKEFIRISGMSHVRTSPGYPQSNGKLERWYQTLKNESIRQKCPLSLEDARRIVFDFVEYYNKVRLHSALGYITPWDKLLGREDEIFKQRQKKLALARQRRINNMRIEIMC
jgi:putative transposase